MFFFFLFSFLFTFSVLTQSPSPPHPPIRCPSPWPTSPCRLCVAARDLSQTQSVKTCSHSGCQPSHGRPWCSSARRCPLPKSCRTFKCILKSWQAVHVGVYQSSV
ncbi:hypothetical protein BCR44DRAFT_311026 [Catenaria anguillulae PL171]|uniref:Secreted protein n=1 Tax=Catenaria anguillulae PL171 TaxID=765915 RepID=A0A1Y2HUN0_9FUNG|nr:hypothetical protein BCR44DRAFT_311026 [Catenaria anguillulae PL171]